MCSNCGVFVADGIAVTVEARGRAGGSCVLFGKFQRLSLVVAFQ